MQPRGILSAGEYARCLRVTRESSGGLVSGMGGKGGKGRSERRLPFPGRASKPSRPPPSPDTHPIRGFRHEIFVDRRFRRVS